MAANLNFAVKLGNDAKRLGYRQMIFVSSAQVWGSLNDTVSFRDIELPETPYARAKLEAEVELLTGRPKNFAVSIIRPPLVYGPGVKGNLAALMCAVQLWPICPLGCPTNRRSLVNVRNLALFIDHLATGGIDGRFNLHDAEPLSSMDILLMIADRMNRRSRITEMPMGLQKLLKVLSNRISSRLLGSLCVDDDSSQQTGFCPSFTQAQGFDEMAHAHAHAHALARASL